MAWLIFSALSAITYTIHDLILKHYADKINNVFASFILNFSASIALGIVLIYYFLTNQKEVFSLPDKISLPIISVAGICLALASFFFIKAFSVGGLVTAVLPSVYILIIILGVLFGVIFLKESISLTQIIGLGLSIVGLILATGLAN
jgi:uncharacterized membrane protein